MWAESGLSLWTGRGRGRESVGWERVSARVVQIPLPPGGTGGSEYEWGVGMGVTWSERVWSLAKDANVVPSAKRVTPM